MTDTCIVCLGDLGLGDASLPSPLPAPLSAVSDHQTANLCGAGQELPDPLTRPTKRAGQELEIEKVATLLPCGHYLHDECLKPWVERANSCPICRQTFHKVELRDTVQGEWTRPREDARSWLTRMQAP